jgi:hypothetical protein
VGAATAETAAATEAPAAMTAAAMTAAAMTAATVGRHVLCRYETQREYREEGAEDFGSGCHDSLPLKLQFQSAECLARADADVPV